MSEMTPIDVSTAVALTGALTKSRADVIEAKKLATDLGKAVEDVKANLVDESKKFGAQFGETKAKLDDLAGKMADAVDMIGKAHLASEKFDKELKAHAEAIEKMHADLKKRGTGTDEETKKLLADRKSAKSLIELKSAGWDKLDPVRELASISDDQFEEYKQYQSAMDKAFRAPTSVDRVADMLTDTERKAISTFTHGNRFWITSELAEKIVACYKVDTDLTQFVDIMPASRGTVEFLQDIYPQSYAQFKCELDCAPKPAPNEPVPGTIAITAYEQFADTCITHTMIEDSSIDIQQWVASKIAMQFLRGTNNVIFNGPTGGGSNAPDYISRPSNHLTFQSGVVAGQASGTFGWQDIEAMAIALDVRFQNMNTYWWVSRAFQQSLMTMTDSFGRPIYSSAVLNQQGMPMLAGYPVVRVEQMNPPLAVFPATGYIPGAKPAYLGDWKSHYTMIVRRGFSAFRNPYVNSKCGVTWEFSQRIGGGVLCKNAAIALEIR